MNKTKVYIATHKKFDEPKIENYIPLHVGAINGKNLGYLTDDTGENISNQNTHYCELTGLYWIWKNTTDENVGLVHYRRYFTTFENYGKIIETDLIENILNNVDIIVPCSKIYNVSNKTQYWMTHYLSDLYKVKDICHRLFPEYDYAFEWFLKQKKMYAYNMFIAHKEIVDNYCEWLFSILFELQKTTNFNEYSPYQARLFGFLSERLFNVWLKKNNYKIQELPVFNSENFITEKSTYITDKYYVSYFGMLRHFITQILRITRF